VEEVKTLRRSAKNPGSAAVAAHALALARQRRYSEPFRAAGDASQLTLVAVADTVGVYEGIKDPTVKAPPPLPPQRHGKQGSSPSAEDAAAL